MSCSKLASFLESCSSVVREMHSVERTLFLALICCTRTSKSLMAAVFSLMSICISALSLCNNWKLTFIFPRICIDNEVSINSPPSLEVLTARAALCDIMSSSSMSKSPIILFIEREIWSFSFPISLTLLYKFEISFRIISFSAKSSLIFVVVSLRDFSTASRSLRDSMRSDSRIAILPLSRSLSSQATFFASSSCALAFSTSETMIFIRCSISVV